MKEIIFETGINLIETFILIDFLTKYLGCKYTGFKRTVGFLLGWMVTFVELCIINYFVEFETIGTYIPIIIYFSAVKSKYLKQPTPHFKNKIFAGNNFVQNC